MRKKKQTKLDQDAVEHLEKILENNAPMLQDLAGLTPRPQVSPSYILLRRERAEDLEKIVNDYLRDGLYLPAGGATYSSKQGLWIQAIYIKGDEK